MILNLNISERLAAVTILNGFKGTLDKLVVILDDIKQFAVEEDEWAKAERKINKQLDGEVVWNWDNEKGGDKEIDIKLDTAEYIKDHIDEMNKKGEFTIKDKSFITLQAKLK